MYLYRPYNVCFYWQGYTLRANNAINSPVQFKENEYLNYFLSLGAETFVIYKKIMKWEKKPQKNPNTWIASPPMIVM